MESCVWGPCGSSGSITVAFINLGYQTESQRWPASLFPPSRSRCSPACSVTCDSSGDLWHMCRHTLSHLSAPGGYLSPRAGLPPGRVGRSLRTGPLRPGPLHWLPVFGLLAFLDLWEFWLRPLQCLQRNSWISTQESTSLRRFYFVGSGSIYLWKGLPYWFLPGPFSPSNSLSNARCRVGAPCNSSPGRRGREAVTRLGSRCPHSPEVTCTFSFLKGSPVYLPGILSLRFTKLAVECSSRGG